MKKSAINIITASRDQPERIIVDAAHQRLLQEITYTVQMESNRTHHSGWLLTKCCYDQIPIECGISKLLQLRFRSDSWPCAFGMIVSVTFRVIANTKSIYKHVIGFLVFLQTICETVTHSLRRRTIFIGENRSVLFDKLVKTLNLFFIKNVIR